MHANVSRSYDMPHSILWQGTSGGRGPPGRDRRKAKYYRRHVEAFLARHMRENRIDEDDEDDE